MAMTAVAAGAAEAAVVCLDTERMCSCSTSSADLASPRSP